MYKLIYMLERWFGHSKDQNQNTTDQESYIQRLGLNSFSERQKKEAKIREKVEADLNRSDLEDISQKIWKLTGRLSVAEPVDLQYTKPDPEKATLIRAEIDEVVALHGSVLADYLKLKREMCKTANLSNPGEVDYAAAKVLVEKGLMGKDWTEWRWENKF